MPALPAVILGPPDFLRRSGPESAVRVDAKQPVSVRYVLGGSTYIDTIAVNTPVIPWLPLTGFGNGVLPAPADPPVAPTPVAPPSANGSFDLTAARWIVFFLPVSGGAATLYAVADIHWQEMAAHTRVVVPLAVVDLHQDVPVEYGLADQPGLAQGQVTTILVAASSDMTTHGDYSEIAVTFPTAYPTLVRPTIQGLTLDNPDFVPYVKSVTATGFTLGVRRLRSLITTEWGSTTCTIAAGDRDNSGSPTVVTFSPAFETIPPSVTVSGPDPDFVVLAPAVTVGPNDFHILMYYRPTNAGDTSQTPAGTAVANNTTGITATASHGAHHHTSAAAGSPTTDDDAHAHGITGAEDTGHGHGTNEPNAGLGHKHTLPALPDVGISSVTRTVQWTATGRQLASALNVVVSWSAFG